MSLWKQKGYVSYASLVSTNKHFYNESWSIKTGPHYFQLGQWNKNAAILQIFFENNMSCDYLPGNFYFAIMYIAYDRMIECVLLT